MIGKSTFISFFYILCGNLIKIAIKKVYSSVFVFFLPSELEEFGLQTNMHSDLFIETKLFS